MPQHPSLIDIDALKMGFPDRTLTTVAVVSIWGQRLVLYGDGRFVRTYPVSTSKYGLGNREGSNQTPLGAHCVREKIGDRAPLGTIFKGRKNTQRLARIITEKIKTDEDFVTSRILWLAGLEPDVNKGEGIDSYARYIYIHGTHEEGLIGQPASHGCVRMTNRDVIELYDRMREDDLVIILE